MRTVETLIAEAIDLCQGEANLARRLGWSKSQVSDLKSHRTPPSPETVALLCDVVQCSGEECQRLAAEAVVMNPKNRERQAALRRAFFGGLATGVAVALQMTGNQIEAATIAAGPLMFAVYTLCAAVRRRLRRAGPGRAMPARSIPAL